MITNQTKKLVVSILLALVTITTTSTAPERYSQETADALFKAYYPHLAHSQRHAEEARPTPIRTVEPLSTDYTQAPAALPTPRIIPAPERKPVVPANLESEEEENDDAEEAEEESTWTQTALAKTKAFVMKTKEVLSKPGAQAATLAVSIVAYSATKALKSALAQHSDKSGTEKLKAIFGTLKSAGLGKALLGTQKSLAQDSSLKQAFVGMAVDSVVELATGALGKLVQSKLKTA